jgi:hypothetical protein
VSDASVCRPRARKISELLDEWTAVSRRLMARADARTVSTTRIAESSCRTHSSTTTVAVLASVNNLTDRVDRRRHPRCSNSLIDLVGRPRRRRSCSLIVRVGRRRHRKTCGMDAEDPVCGTDRFLMVRARIEAPGSPRHATMLGHLVNPWAHRQKILIEVVMVHATAHAMAHATAFVTALVMDRLRSEIPRCRIARTDLRAELRIDVGAAAAATRAVAAPPQCRSTTTTQEGREPRRCLRDVPCEATTAPSSVRGRHGLTAPAPAATSRLTASVRGSRLCGTDARPSPLSTWVGTDQQRMDVPVHSTLHHALSIDAHRMMAR